MDEIFPVTDEDLGEISQWLQLIEANLQADVEKKTIYYNFAFEKGVPIEAKEHRFEWTEEKTNDFSRFSILSTLPSVDMESVSEIPDIPENSELLMLSSSLRPSDVKFKD